MCKFGFVLAFGSGSDRIGVTKPAYSDRGRSATAKALANSLSKPFVAVPTIAATCAAVANLSIMYTEDGVYIEFPVFVRGTLLCLVDTEVIAGPPVRYLGAGITDTLAKWIEAPMSAAGKKQNLPTIGGLQAAKLCYDTLIKTARKR